MSFTFPNFGISPRGLCVLEETMDLHVMAATAAEFAVSVAWISGMIFLWKKFLM